MADMSDDASKNISRQKWKNIYLPKRYIFVFLAQMGMVSMCAIRSSMSILIVAMVDQTSSVADNSSFDGMAECPNFDDYGSENTLNNSFFKGEKYDWDIKTQANILGSYFYGSLVTQVLGGLLAEKFGAKYVFGGGILLKAVVFMMTPLISSYGYIPVIVNQVIQGLGDGLTCPAISVAISRWSPKNERSRISTIIYSGLQIGIIVSMPISGLLCSSDVFGGWPSAVYLFGTMACIWFIFWSIFFHEKPSVHPGISNDELFYIEENKNEQTKRMTLDLWKSMFASIPMWALVITHFSVDFGFLIFLQELPTYLNTVLHFNLTSNGFISTLPFICIIIGALVASFIADYLRKTNKLSITLIRKLMNSIGMFTPGVILLSIKFAGCRAELIVCLLCIAMLFFGFALSGFNVTHVDMCPEFAGKTSLLNLSSKSMVSGTMFGITNTIANISGVLGPLSVGSFTASGPTLENWSYVFFTTAGIYLFGGTIFVLFASAELQQWGIVPDTSNKDTCIVKGVNVASDCNLTTKL